jgi:hypothetical protein
VSSARKINQDKITKIEVDYSSKYDQRMKKSKVNSYCATENE